MFDQALLDRMTPNGKALITASFFNTTHEVEPKLSEYRAKAAHQDNAVLDMIEALGGSAAPSTIWRACSKKWPITSIRRACTNLTKAGKLVKTDRKHVGEFGRSEYVWAIPEKP